jgi:hypothetical protein
MDIQIINPINRPDWDKLIIKTPGYSFFHSSSWAKTLNDSYQYTPIYFTLFKDDRIVALIPCMDVSSVLTGHKGVSLPFSDYCEPVFGSLSEFNELFNHITDYGRKCKWKYLELRGAQKALNGTMSSEKYLHHSIDLTMKENFIFSNFRKGTKSAIHKAAREGVEVKILKTIESVNEFCKLNCITRKRHGLPPQPYRFFKNFFKHIISMNLGFVALASFQEKIIAGAVFALFGEKAMYKYAASDTNFQYLRANNLILWEAIQWLCKYEYKSLCLGRTELENDGLRRFKTGWNTTEDVIEYYRYDMEKDAFMEVSQMVGDFNTMLFRRMPVPLLKIIGSLLYRHIG